LAKFRCGLELIKAIAEQPNYGKKLEADGKAGIRYHLIDRHGGAWIYKWSFDRKTVMPRGIDGES
jgi:hypothetical protein